MNDDTTNQPVDQSTQQNQSAAPLDVPAQNQTIPDPMQVNLPADNIESKVPDWDNKPAWSSDNVDLNASDFTSDKNLEFGQPEPPKEPSVEDSMTQPEPDPVVPQPPMVEETTPATEPEESQSIPEPETDKNEPTEAVAENSGSETEVDSALEEAVKAKEEVNTVKKKAQEEIDSANENARTKAEQVLKIIDEAVAGAEKIADAKKAELSDYVNERQAEIDEIHERVAKLKRKKTEMKQYLGIENK